MEIKDKNHIKFLELNNLNSLALKADYDLKNCPCSCNNKEISLWDEYELNENFKYCPFCGKVIMRVIYINKNSNGKGGYIGGTVILPKKR